MPDVIYSRRRKVHPIEMESQEQVGKKVNADGVAGVDPANRSVCQNGSCGKSKATIHCAFHKCLIYSMTVFGLFYPRHFKDAGNKLCAVLMVYSTGVMVFLFFNTARVLFTAYDGQDAFNAVLFNKTNYAAWFLLCSINSIIHNFMSYLKNGGIRKYYVRLYKIIGDLDSVGVKLPWSGMWKVEFTCLVLGWLLIIANIAYSLNSLFDDYRFESWKVFCRLQPGNLTSDYELGAMRYVTGVHLIFSTGCWIWPVVYIIDVGMHMGHAFSCLNKHIKQIVSSDHASFLKDVGLYRHIHHRICKCIESADSFFSFTLGLHIIFFLLLTMLEFYNIVWSDMLRDPAHVDMLVAYITWLVASIAMLSAECLASSFVASQAQQTVDHLYQLTDKCGELDNHQLFQVSLFLNQLSRPNGFNVMGLFVLSKEATLTILGSWVTYFLIIIQFNPPNGS